MEEYVSNDGRGFCHLLTDKREASVASSATCIASLVHTGRWPDFSLAQKAADVASFLLSKRDSADLGVDNPFTISFIAEGIRNLQQGAPKYADANEHHETILTEFIPNIQEAVRSPTPWIRPEIRQKVKPTGVTGAAGAVAIFPYPPSAYLTQLAYRVLKSWTSTDTEIDQLVHAWSLREINKQVALIAAGSRVADPMQLAYALITAVNSRPDTAAKPEEKEIFGHALRTFFEAQRPDGGWPLSRPMFHYQEVGNAYCFEYELLTQLLECDLLLEELLRYLPELSRAAEALEDTKFDLDNARDRRRVGWASGHHPQLPGPESWSTASVYHFAHALNRVVAEAIRKQLFSELGREYDGPPGTPQSPPDDDDLKGFADDFLDAELKPAGTLETLSLRSELATKFVYPIARAAHFVREGQSLPDETPMSAIFFGPPGTSKTTLAKIISDYLHWPLLEVDPSYVVKDGLDKVQAVANKLFTMLELAEEVVVLLDEFDEMGRDRTANQDLLSRFITTAMLPKLASINQKRRIVFLLATNYVSDFDAAFSRSGRFDIMLQVMPPSAAEKKEKWPILEKKVDLLAGEDRTKANDILTDLTYDEAKLLARKLEAPGDVSVMEVFEAAAATCTLRKTNRTAKSSGPDADVEDKKGSSWKDTCEEERTKIRLR